MCRDTSMLERSRWLLQYYPAFPRTGKDDWGPRRGSEHLPGSWHHIGAHRSAQESVPPKRQVTGKAFKSSHTTSPALLPRVKSREMAWGRKDWAHCYLTKANPKPFPSSPKPMHFLNIWYLHTQTNSIFPFLCTFFFSFKKTAIHIILGLQNKLQLAGYLRPHLWNSGTVFLHQPLHTSSL